MTTEIVEYSVDLSFGPLSESSLAAVKKYIRETGFHDVILTDRRFFWDSYSGRDSDRRVLAFLRSVASVLWNADGEVKASLTYETDEESFESYHVRNGKLTAI